MNSVDLIEPAMIINIAFDNFQSRHINTMNMAIKKIILSADADKHVFRYNYEDCYL